MNARNQSLDVLRGVAVLLVMCQHYPLFPLADRGWIGVDLFFILSGFLISGLLFSDVFRRGRIDISRFYIRRGFKIYPPFYALLIFVATSFPGISKSLLVDAVFLQNYVGQNLAAKHVVGHLWSLGVEEHFYIMLPLLLLLLNRLNLLHWIPGVALGLLVLCFWLRSSYCRVHGLEVFPTHLRIDCLFAGVALGYFAWFQPRTLAKLNRRWVPLAVVMLLLPVVFWRSFPTMVFTANVLSFSLLLAWAVARRFPRLSLLSSIGKYSYSIYLWHLPIAVIWHLKPMSWPGLLGYMMTSIIFGIGMARLIEVPALRLRERLFPATAAIPAQELALTVRSAAS